MAPRVVIVGGGLGGLECGVLLQRNGCDVSIIEKNQQAGGCLGSFSRGGLRFDTGFHYAGSLGRGEALSILLEYMGAGGLPWQRLDPDCSDEVVIDGDSFPMASGHETFAERLGALFPSERKSLEEYASLLKVVGDGIFKAFCGGGTDRLFSTGAQEYLDAKFKDPLLKKVLCGAFMRYVMTPSLPLYPFAQINDSFVRSSWRLSGGGAVLSGRLEEEFLRLGGTLTAGTAVTEVHVSGDRADYVAAGPERFDADLVVSDLHPSVFFPLVAPASSLRKTYRDRISSLDNTGGVFTANIVLKPGKVRYLDRNIFIHSGGDKVMVHFYPVPQGSMATHLDLISPMPYVSPDSPGYGEAKLSMLERCLSLACSRLPELRDSVSAVYTSSPSTYQRFTGTPGGPAFGIRKDFTRPLETVLSPRTPLRNVFLTGQNLNLHGILGVSMTSVLTCMEILGRDSLSLPKLR